METAKIIGTGYVALGKAFNVRTVIFRFYANGKITSKVKGEREFTEWCGEPVLLDSLFITDFTLFDKFFSAWDD